MFLEALRLHDALNQRLFGSPADRLGLFINERHISFYTSDQSDRREGRVLCVPLFCVGILLEHGDEGESKDVACHPKYKGGEQTFDVCLIESTWCKRNLKATRPRV